MQSYDVDLGLSWAFNPYCEIGDPNCTKCQPQRTPTDSDVAQCMEITTTPIRSALQRGSLNALHEDHPPTFPRDEDQLEFKTLSTDQPAPKGKARRQSLRAALPDVWQFTKSRTGNSLPDTLFTFCKEADWDLADFAGDIEDFEGSMIMDHLAEEHPELSTPRKIDIHGLLSATLSPDDNEQSIISLYSSDEDEDISREVEEYPPVVDADDFDAVQEKLYQYKAYTKDELDEFLRYCECKESDGYADVATESISDAVVNHMKAKFTWNGIKAEQFRQDLRSATESREVSPPCRRIRESRRDPFEERRRLRAAYR